MAFTAQTPQRRLPGAYIQTPAPKSGQILYPNFRFQAAPSIPQLGSHARSQALAPPKQQVAQEGGKTAGETLKPLERAAKTINDTLALETKFPELDSYVGRKSFRA